MILALIAAATLSQGASSQRGAFVTQRSYATSAITFLFVDASLGSDSNACTSSGASACLTIAGALAKVPTFLRHLVSISIAAGTYAENVQLTRFTSQNGGGLNLTGATPTAVTPATGTASGTWTAVAGTTSSADPTTIVLTDSAQTWTVNDFKGKLVSLAGTIRAIASNTATTITLAGGTTLPTVGAAYTIVSPPSIISPATGSALVVAATSQGSTTGNVTSFVFSNLDFVTTAGATPVVAISTNSQMQVSFVSSRIRTAVASLTALNTTGPVKLSLANTSVQSTSGVALNSVSLTSFSGNSAFLTGGSTTSATFLLASESSTQFTTSLPSTFENTSASGVVFRTNNATIPLSTVVPTTGKVRILCGGGTSIGIAASTSGTAYSSNFQVAGFYNMEMENCGTGFSLGGTRVGLNNIALSGSTLGVDLYSGAVFNVVTPTFTSNTTDIALDTTTTSTLAAIQALTLKWLTIFGSGTSFRTVN